MGTEIFYKTLYGGSSTGAISSLLRVNDFTFLLDCGWDDDFDTAQLEPLKEVAHEIDAVLISHPDPAHLAALPYLVGSLNMSAPIYATGAVHKMGQMFLYDQYLSRRQTSDFDAFTLDDVDAAFQRMRQLKYQQQVQLTGKGQGMSVTAFSAGHLVGGALWQVLTRDEEQLVYAVHWNHRKDRHLRRADLDGRFNRPALLVTDACSARAPPTDVARRDAEFLRTVTTALQTDGNVLIPCDAAGRCLEVALLLEQHWQRQRLPYALVLLTPVAYSTLEFARSQLEWMNQDISDQFNRSRSNPFELRHVKVCHSKEDIWQLPPGPRVVLASIPSLAAGMSLQLLVDWGPNPNNVILFPGPAPEGSTAALLQKRHGESSEGLQLDLLLGLRVPLEGADLEAWQAAQREAELAAASELEAGEQAAQAANPDPSIDVQGQEDMHQPEEAVAGAVGSSLPASEMLKPLIRETLIDGFEAPEDADSPMFSSEGEEELIWTEYGTTLRPGEHQRRHGEGEAADAPSDDASEPEVPTRVVTSEVRVHVRARVATFDFRGNSDAHSVQTVLGNVAPRHLVIAGGCSEDKEVLRAACEARSEIRWDVHVAEDSTAINVSSGSSSYKVALSDELLRGLHFRSVGPAGRVAWLTARAVSSEEGDMMKMISAHEVSANAQEGGVFVGDVKLSGLKKALGDGGISSQFLGGMLVCQKRILVKSVGSTGQLVLEGPCCEDYYRIRDIVFAQYNIC